MSKILHVYRTYFPDPQGGGQEAIRQIALASQTFGHEPRVFALSPTPWPELVEDHGITVLRSRSWAAPASCDLGGPKAFSAFSKAADWADVIHYHYPWPFADVLESVVRPDRAKVVTYHSDIVRQRLLKQFYSPLMHRMLDSMDIIVATSPAYAATSPVLADPRHAERVRIIPLGIEENSYPASVDTDIFNKMRLDPNSPYFLFVGVLRYYKGLQFLIEAAKSVDAPIVIAGSGPEETLLKARSTGLGLSNVIFAGQVTDAQKVALLERCRAFVLPSHLRSEAFGVVLIEAGMYRRPMISCEVGSGTSFANTHGETGLVVAPEDVDALARAMNVLLGNETLAEKFGGAARQRYESLFSGPALGKAYAQLYQDVLKNGRLQGPSILNN